MPPHVLAVTSFSQDGYETYGRKMVDSFLANTDENFGLFVFSDKNLEDISNHSPRVAYYALDKAVPSQLEFERRHQSPVCHGRIGGAYDYRMDAVRFSHKPAAILAALQVVNDSPDLSPEVLLWLDGDTVFKKQFTLEFFQRQFPVWAHLGHFSRKANHTEGGIIAFRISEENARIFIRLMWEAYIHDQVFALPAWTDCHVLDVMIAGATRDGFLRVKNLGDDLSHNTQHPIVNSEWFAYVDHLKGARKQNGASFESDIVKVAE
jgi:hypothetical protein